jgi:hypothetical protein
MSETNSESCPNCNHNTLEKRFSIPAVIMDSSQPKTIGELADKNTERMVARGEMDKSALDYKANSEKRAKERSHLNDLAHMTPSQQKRYIMEGKK